MAKRNKDILSDNDLMTKYANVVEVVRNSKITISYKSNLNYVKFRKTDPVTNKEHFTLYSATPNMKGIPKFVGFMHELAHILFQSPFKGLDYTLVNTWGIEKTSRKYQLYHSVFNVLEDQRIESHMGKMYLKFGKKFEETRTKLGKVHPITNDPLSILLAIRFNRGKDVSDIPYFRDYNNAIKKVEFLDNYGGIRVLAQLRPLLDEWLMDNEQKGIKPTLSEGFEAPDRSNDSIEDIPEDLTENQTEEQIEQGIQESRELGEDNVSEIFEILNQQKTMERGMPKRTRLVTRKPAEVKVDEPIANGLRKIFKKAVLRDKEFINNNGNSVDVQSYVDNLISGKNLNNCRIDEKNDLGVSIVVSIDGSTSMRGDRINTARTLMATMYKSIKNLKNVHLRANIWGSKGDGEIGVTEINSENDVKYISIESNQGYYYATPTHTAFQYSAKMLKEMKGKRKVLIIITDGHPNHYNNGHRIAAHLYETTCKKAYNVSKHTISDIFCICIEDQYRFKYNPIKRIIKPSKIMRVDSSNNASENVIKKFRKTVMSSFVR